MQNLRVRTNFEFRYVIIDVFQYGGQYLERPIFRNFEISKFELFDFTIFNLFFILRFFLNSANTQNTYMIIY